MATTFRTSELFSQTTASLSGLFTAHKTERESDAWPNPELSIGRFITKYGRVSCWEARGPAREAFDSIAPTIKDYLERSVEPISRWVTWSIYMFGKTHASASPTIMFCCEVAAHRKEVRNIVRESGLLNGYRGIKTGHMPKAPDFEQLIPLAGAVRQKTTRKLQVFTLPGSRRSHDNDPDLHRIIQPPPLPPIIIGGSEVESEAEIEVDIETTSLSSRNNHDNGWKIFVGGSGSPATIGGIIKSGGEIYYTTAAHVFQGHDCRAEGTSEGEADEDSGIDIDGFDDGDFESDGEADSNSDEVPDEVPSSLEEAAPLPNPNNSPNADSKPEYIIRAPLLVLSLGVPVRSHPGLDYALIKFPDYPDERTNQVRNPKSRSHNTVTITALASPKLKETREVLSATSRGVLTGTLSGAPVYCRSPNSTQYTMSLTAVFDSPLQVGDCGSWVVDAQTGDLYGHIVAGSPGTGRAIVVPFDSIFEDIKLRTGERPQLPGEVSKAVDMADGSWAQDLGERFRALLAVKRSELLRNGAAQPGNPDDPKAAEPPPYTAGTVHPILRTIPVLPAPPQPDDIAAQDFRKLLLALGASPLKYEDAWRLDKALGAMPLDRLYAEAEEEAQIMQAEAESLGDGSRPLWAYQDCIVRALLRWFKRDFFTWVNNPPCGVCGTATVAAGAAPPTDEERAWGAMRVESFRCANAECGSDERFPRYADPAKLLETRRGRVGEWTNCFSMLCRAVGARVRWVWNAEDHVWTEVYSEHQRRWVHVDACEEAWDAPLLYTQGWGRKMSYCIAFSVDGATDVRRRYIRRAEHANSDVRCPEPVLHHIIAEVRNLRREKLSAEEISRLAEEDRLEERELSWYVAEDVVDSLSQSVLGVTEEGRETRKSTSDKGKRANWEWSTGAPSRLHPGPSR